MTIKELRATYEYLNLRPKQQAYVEAFLECRNSLKATRKSYTGITKHATYQRSFKLAHHPRVQLCIARFDHDSAAGALQRLKEHVFGSRKMSYREVQAIKFVIRMQMDKLERAPRSRRESVGGLTPEERVKLFESSVQ